MNSLKEAWEWYQAAATAAKRLDRLAEYWGRFSWGLADDANTPRAADPELTRYSRLLDEIARDNTLGKLDADTTPSSLRNAPLNPAEMRRQLVRRGDV